jgi:hypothetical protein
MQSFIMACVAALVIAIASYAVLNTFDRPASESFMSPTSTRI